MPILRSTAVVLKKIPFRETSLIVRFFTKEYGKVSCLFKGIRLKPEKFASRLESFSLNELIFYKNPHNDLHLASQCDLKENFTLLRKDIERVRAAANIAHFIDSFMPAEEANEEVFELLRDCLFQLQDQDFQKIIFIFQIKALSLTGFEPRLDYCIMCENRMSYSDRTYFSAAKGGILCEKCVKQDRASRPLFKGTIASLSYIQKNNLQDSLRLGLNMTIKKELSALLLRFLNYHLDFKLEDPAISGSVK